MRLLLDSGRALGEILRRLVLGSFVGGKNKVGSHRNRVWTSPPPPQCSAGGFASDPSGSRCALVFEGGDTETVERAQEETCHGPTPRSQVQAHTTKSREEREGADEAQHCHAQQFLKAIRQRESLMNHLP